MSNINGFNTSVDENDDSIEQSLHELNFESTITDQIYSSSYMSMSSQQPTSLSQLVFDGRSHHSNQITNERTNYLIAYQSCSRHPSILVNEFDTPIGESRPWTEDSVFSYVFAANRSEQSNNRIAYPSDAVQNIFINLLSPVVVRLIFDSILNTVPLGIQDTHPHTMVLPVFVNTTRRGIVINNENGDINEDGTLFNDADDLINDENMNLTTTMTGYGDQMIMRESTGTETTDDFTNNVNSIVSTDAQDDNYSDINNRDERFIECSHTSEIEHQDNNDERGQATPRPEHADNNGIQNNVQLNMPTAPALVSSVPTTSTIGSSEQAEEIEPILAGPTDNHNHTTTDPAHLLATGLDVSQSNVRNQKQASSIDPDEKVGEEKIVQ